MNWKGGKEMKEKVLWVKGKMGNKKENVSVKGREMKRKECDV